MSEPVPEAARLARLVEMACGDDGDPDDLMDFIRRWSAALRPFHQRLIEAEMVWPWDLMRGMDDATGDSLVGLIGFLASAITVPRMSKKDFRGPA